jgi:hypothetical protein
MFQRSPYITRLDLMYLLDNLMGAIFCYDLQHPDIKKLRGRELHHHFLCAGLAEIRQKYHSLNYALGKIERYRETGVPQRMVWVELTM